MIDEQRFLGVYSNLILESSTYASNKGTEKLLREAIQEYNRQYFAARVAEKQRLNEADKLVSVT